MDHRFGGSLTFAIQGQFDVMVVHRVRFLVSVLLCDRVLSGCLGRFDRAGQKGITVAFYAHDQYICRMSGSITTKTGDQGSTRLYSGEEVGKSDLRISACGDIDELNSALGFVRAHPDAAYLNDALLGLQRSLFLIGSMISTTPGEGASDRIQEMTQQDVDDLTQRSSAAEATIQMPDDFILPGGTELGARLDVARSVSRRVERSVVGVAAAGHLDATAPVAWLNRLSDYLWILARQVEGEQLTPRCPNA